jgi:GT2 family glycosyltransferase
VLKKLRIATLATCYNRKIDTYNCLKSLLIACDIAGVESSHFIVDDNSSDGTSEMISVSFPQVRILHGTGHLYWSGGMRFGFDHISDNYEFDFLITYNDDCVFNEQCIQLLLEGFNSVAGKVGIVVGTLVDPRSGEFTYGGRSSRWRSCWLPPSFRLAKPSSTYYL